MHYALNNVTIERKIIHEKADSEIRTTERVPQLIASGRIATAWYDYVCKAIPAELAHYTLKIQSILIVLICSHDYHRKAFQRSTHTELNQNSVHRRCHFVLMGQPVQSYQSICRMSSQRCEFCSNVGVFMRKKCFKRNGSKMI
jgi:hypothetical protein